MLDQVGKSGSFLTKLISFYKISEIRYLRLLTFCSSQEYVEQDRASPTKCVIFDFSQVILSIAGLGMTSYLLL